MTETFIVVRNMEGDGGPKHTTSVFADKQLAEEYFKKEAHRSEDDNDPEYEMYADLNWNRMALIRATGPFTISFDPYGEGVENDYEITGDAKIIDEYTPSY